MNTLLLSRQEYDLLLFYTFDIDRQYQYYYDQHKLDYTKEQIGDLCIERYIKEVNQLRETNKEPNKQEPITEFDKIKEFITHHLQQKSTFIAQQNAKIEQEVSNNLNMYLEPAKTEPPKKIKINIPLPEPYSHDYCYIGEQYEELRKLQPI